MKKYECIGGIVMQGQKNQVIEEIRFESNFKGQRHDHLWGYELWIENNERYCNKLLVLNSGFESSWHYHERKDEVFIILSGKVRLTYSLGHDISGAKSITLKEGDKFRLKPNMVHTFRSETEKSIVMEVSTTDDGDNIKLRPARKIEENED